MSPHCEKLESGLKVVLVPCESESVAVGMFVASGSRHEDNRRAGISHFIEHMLFKGTEKRSALEITREIEGRGGSFNAFTSEESTCFYAHMPDDYLEEALDILIDMFKNAKIGENEFAMEKSVILEEIKMYGDDPDSVVMENLQKCLFPGHPLGRSVAGDMNTVSALTREDMKGWIKSHYLPAKTTLVVAGHFDEAKVLERARGL
ncbi:MAG: insulinase family protein [Kiritimatiellae bacterium]|nr:insulinase family protein [Kiritimatiellia bacterium]